MASPDLTFREAKFGSTPIRELGLTISGTVLEPILADFQAELEQAGVRRLRPRFYLSNEWGVPFDTISLAIPFYLARPDLTAIHADRLGFVEGLNRSDILRYLRHEMGHVVNYAYRLYETEEWVKHFGSITQPYVEEYRPQPFSRRYVHHLPGWYAQKHPDEDWAETFAVWITPGANWRDDYSDWPQALAKLEYCQQTLADVSEREPLVTAEDLDQDVKDMDVSVEQFYKGLSPSGVEFPRGLDGALRAIFEDQAAPEDGSTAQRKRASLLIQRLRRDMTANIYRWTGHFPERTYLLLRHLAERADQLNQVYAEDKEAAAIAAITALVTALAMNYVHRGSYLP